MNDISAVRNEPLTLFASAFAWITGFYLTRSHESTETQVRRSWRKEVCFIRCYYYIISIKTNIPLIFTLLSSNIPLSQLCVIKFLCDKILSKTRHHTCLPDDNDKAKKFEKTVLSELYKFTKYFPLPLHSFHCALTAFVIKTDLHLHLEILSLWKGRGLLKWSGKRLFGTVVKIKKRCIIL